MQAELRTHKKGVSRGMFMNLGRGGCLVETNRSLSRGDLLRIRIGEEQGDRSERIVLFGRTVWCAVGHENSKRCGVVFLEEDREVFEEVQKFREICHAKEISKSLGLTFVDLAPFMVEKRVLQYVSKELALSLNCVPIKLRGDELMVAMADPGDMRGIKKLELLSQCRIVPVVATQTAIRETLIQCWGAEYTPPEGDRLEPFSVFTSRTKRGYRVIALASSTPDLVEDTLAANLSAILERDGKRAFHVRTRQGSPVLLDRVMSSYAEGLEIVFLTLPLDKEGSSLDWISRADESVLLVSPTDWERGCRYLEAVFDRFVERQQPQGPVYSDGSMRHRLLEVSIICAQVSNMREGFSIFSRMENRLHQDLDMRVPWADMRLHYLGGILNDERGLKKSRKAGIPLAAFKPSSRATQCLTHIAQSLLLPPSARDPRPHLIRSMFSRFLGGSPGKQK
jgi:Tfp pilus assembly protein PilZ